MRVLALDQSSAHTGYAVYEDGKFIKKGCINAPMSQDLYQRTVRMANDIEALINLEKPDFLVLEEIYGMPGRYTALKALSIVRGAIIIVWSRYSKTQPLVIPCSNARKAIGIKGNAKKDEVMSAVQSKFKIPMTNEHEADAIVLGVVGSDLLTTKNAVPKKNGKMLVNLPMSDTYTKGYATKKSKIK